MIYTCTLNPAIDLFVATDALLPHRVNRTDQEDYQANGKGVNVSIILKRLGVDSTALGFIGGFTGRYIEDELQRMGIKTDFIEVDGITRVNMFVHTAEEEYKIVNGGPTIDSKSIEEMLEKVRSLPNGCMLFVSGSTPRGVDDNIYREIAKIAYEKEIDLILDISSKVLLDCLPYHPYIIKPNEDEIAAFYDKENLSDEEIIELGYDLLDKGAQRLLISLGKDGAIYLDHAHLIKVSSAQGEVINTACAGDTMLAMFMQKVMSGSSIEKALIYSSAAGSSTAFSIGLSDLTDVEDLVQQVKSTNYKGGTKHGEN